MAARKKIVSIKRSAKVATASSKMSQKQSMHSVPLVKRRHTQQLDAVLAAFVAEDRPLGPSEVLHLASKNLSGIGLTTVYRLIKRLTEQEKIVVVELPGCVPRYELAGKRHHHHFLCSQCDRTYELDACRGKFDGLAPRGFDVTSHDLFLRGRCADCIGA